MKKLLTYLGIILLTTAPGVSLVGCKPINNNANSGGGGSDNDINNDLKILSKIEEESLSDLNDYSAQQNNIIDITLGGVQPAFSAIAKLVSKEKPDVNLDYEDANYGSALQYLYYNFKQYFNNSINAKIKHQYAAYYLTSDPLMLAATPVKISATYIDLDTLASLINDPSIKTATAVTINIALRYTVQYKTYSSNIDYNIKFIATDRVDAIKNTIGKIIGIISDATIGYFNNLQNVTIDDPQSKFYNIFQKFQINFDDNKNGPVVNNLVLNGFQDMIKTLPALQNYLSYIKYDNSQSFITLLSQWVNNTTNGVEPVTADSAPWNWTGNGYDPSKITVANFEQFFLKISSIFSSGDVFDLANFKINLNIITIAGLPLSGVVIKGGTALALDLKASKEGMQKKLDNFANIVVKFFNYFHFTSNQQQPQVAITINQDLTNKLKDPNNSHLNNFLPLLINDFKAQKDVQALPDIDLFNGLNDRIYYDSGNDPCLQKQNDSQWLVPYHNPANEDVTGWNFILSFGAIGQWMTTGYKIADSTYLPLLINLSAK
ncbi:hypothetical protein [Spiroplasma sp. DGKH1]|uniref:hypothetical protein n=1 Tax=Spiroplasma sp. DGKH1 TaxID=3050074 RepID=UPI0034C63F90